MRVRRRMLAAAAVALLATGGCVNHAQNSAEFCSRNSDLLKPALDRTVLTKDQAVYYDDNLEKTMRYSEDGSRKVRTGARNLADAYAKVRKIAGDDKVKASDVEERYRELLQRRVEMRAVCRGVEAT